MSAVLPMPPVLPATPVRPAPVAVPVASPPAPPKPLLWTVDEFHDAYDSGIWADRRLILIRGVIFDMGKMKPPHANGIEMVDAALRTAFGAGWRYRIQLPLVLGLDSDPLPDFAVVPGRPGNHPHPTTAVLVVEVADTTLQLDTTTKAELYATAGVADFWVVDVVGRQLIVFRDPQPLATGLGATAYRTHQTLGPADHVAPLAAPAAVIAVADLLP